MHDEIRCDVNSWRSFVLKWALMAIRGYDMEQDVIVD